MTPRWFYLSVNPEPWAVGSLGIGKRNGKFIPRLSPNPQLQAFQEAVREELKGSEQLPEGEYILTFYFWRRLDDYETESGRRHRKHWVDTTNLQKGCEDALQGVLFDNDRRVRRVTSEVVEQGPEVVPSVVIKAELYAGMSPYDERDIPETVWALINRSDQPAFEFDNSWPPPNGVF